MTKNNQEDITHFENLENEINSLLGEMISDPEASSDIDAIIAILFEQGILMNTKNLSNLIVNILKKTHKKSRSQNKKLTKSELSQMLQNLQSVSNFLLIQYTTLSAETYKKHQKKEKKEQKQQVVRDNLKLILKRAIIYEAYKIVNPRRIAGETLEANFKSNIIMKGVKNALKVERKTYKQAEQTYGKGFIKQALKDKQAKKSSGRGI